MTVHKKARGVDDSGSSAYYDDVNGFWVSFEGRASRLCWWIGWGKREDGLKLELPFPEMGKLRVWASCALSLSRVWLLWPHGLWPTRFLCPWNFPSKNSGTDCHFLLQGLFPTQEWKLHLLSPALAGRFFTSAPPRKPAKVSSNCLKNHCHDLEGDWIRKHGHPVQIPHC